MIDINKLQIISEKSKNKKIKEYMRLVKKQMRQAAKNGQYSIMFSIGEIEETKAVTWLEFIEILRAEGFKATLHGFYSACLVVSWAPEKEDKNND